MHTIFKQIFHILIISTILFSCNLRGQDEQKVTEVIPIVKVIHPKKTSLKVSIHTTGKLEPEKQVKLSFKIPGILDELKVVEGQAVRKGDIMAKLDVTEISSKRNQAEEQYFKTERDLKRVENLYQDSVVTLEVLQNARTQHRLSSLQLKVADFNLSKTTIIAPENGVVLSVLSEEKEMIAGGQPVIFFGSAKSNYKVTCQVIDKYIHKIRLRDSVHLSFDALSEFSTKGLIQSIGAMADPYSGTFIVEVSVPKTNLPLFSGLFASVDIYTREERLCYEIPFEAIIEIIEESAKIAIIGTTGYEIRTVQILNIDNNKIQVSGNISEKDQIVVQGFEEIIHGKKYIVQQQNS